MFKLKGKVFAMPILFVTAVFNIAWAAGTIDLPQTGQTMTVQVM